MVEEIITSTEEVDSSLLKSFVERIERLDEERVGLVEDIKSVYDEAKATGFDTKILRKVIAIKSMDKDKREEFETLLDLYLSALGE